MAQLHPDQLGMVPETGVIAITPSHVLRRQHVYAEAGELQARP